MCSAPSHVRFTPESRPQKRTSAQLQTVGRCANPIILGRPCPLHLGHCTPRNATQIEASATADMVKELKKRAPRYQLCIFVICITDIVTAWAIFAKCGEM